MTTAQRSNRKQPQSSKLKMERNCSPEERAELKSATRHSVKMISGKRFALVTRADEPALSEYGSIGSPKFMPIDVLLDLQREFPAGVASPLLTELAALCGFKLVPLSHEGEDEALDLDDVGEIMREGSEAHTSALEVAQKPTCLATIRSAKKEIHEAVAVKAAALRKLAGQERRLLARSA